MEKYRRGDEKQALKSISYNNRNVFDNKETYI